MPLNPILRVIQYLFKKKNIPNNDKTLKSFISNGVSFPQFVALAFNIDNIPDIKLKPTTTSQQSNNNTLAYQYLVDNFLDTSEIVPDYSDNDQNQIQKLLSFILTQKCFKVNPDTILKKCNKIVQYNNIFYNSINDLIEQNCLFTLLNILTGKEVQYHYKTKNIEKLLIQNFEKAKVPLVIDTTSFEEQNQFLFLIQIEIIFDVFSDKIIKENYFLSDFSDLEDSDDNLPSPHSSEKPDEITKNESQKEDDMLSEKPISLSKNKSEINDSRDNHISTQDSIDSYISTQDSIDSYISFQDSRDSLLSTSSDLFNSRKSRKIRKRKKSTFNFDLSEKFLLKAINKICDESYESFEQTIEEENFAKILMQIFKNNKDIQRDISYHIENPENFDKSQIEVLVDYLSTIEPRFKILVLDFENPEFVDSSAILLFNNILNFFFLTSSKQKLFDRCYTILHYGDFEDPNKKDREFSILSKLETYINLLKFVLKRGISDENTVTNDSISQNDETTNETKDSDLKNDELSINLVSILKNEDATNDMLKSNQIPIILNENFLQKYVNEYEIPNIVYFQLQFMFNYLDEKAIHLHVIEYFLIAMRKIKLIKVPLTAKLAKSIRDKNLSLIMQMKRNELHSTKEKKSESENDTEEEEVKIDINNNEMPKTFRDRRIEYSINIQKKRKTLSLIQLLNEETFWNSNDHRHAFHDGILFSKVKKNKSKKDKHQPSSKNKILIPSLRPKKTSNEDDDSNDKIYKFFYYNEETNKWIYNESEFEQFKKDKNIDPIESKLPLILFFGSKEKDSIEVCSKLTGNKINEIKENQIGVFAICDKNDSASKCSIYLLLHVPKVKEKLLNIGRIVIQIYLFLFFIQNAIVIILNDMRKLQLEFQKEIVLISNSFKLQNESKKSNKNKDLNKDDNNNDDEHSEEENDDEEESEIDNNDFYEGDEKIDLLNQINPDFFNKPINYIYIINESENDEPKKDIIKNVTDKLTRKFYPKKKSDSKSVSFKFNFINIYDSNSYGAAFTSLNDYTINCNQNYYNANEIDTNFRFLSLFELSNFYIQLKIDKTDKTNTYFKLNELVKQRFSMLRKNNIDIETNDFTILANLQKEMFSTYPLLDSGYFEICNTILSKLKREISQENNDVIATELSKSSINNLNYLDEIIKNEPYWTNDQIVSIIDGHVNFLKEEFFNIIHDLFPQKIFINIYEENMNILSNRTDTDLKTIHSKFNKFNENLDKKKTTPKKLQKGANSTIRERKHEREISVRVNINGVLEDLIEQDF